MSNHKTLQHTEWDCKYHVVFIPKYRRRVLYGTIREYHGGDLSEVGEAERV